MFHNFNLVRNDIGDKTFVTAEKKWAFYKLA